MRERERKRERKEGREMSERVARERGSARRILSSITTCAGQGQLVYTVEPPLTDLPRCGQPPYNGQYERHRLILACV